jgi:hypothetical protein
MIIFSSQASKTSLGETGAPQTDTPELDLLTAMDRQPWSLVNIRTLIDVFKQVPLSTSGFTLARSSDCRIIVDHLRDALARNRNAFRREQTEFIGQFFNLVDSLEESPIRNYPNELLRLHIVKAEALLECNQSARALETVLHIVERPYLIEGDAHHERVVLGLQQQALMMMGRRQEAAASAWRSLFVCGHASPLQAGAVFRAFAGALHLTSADSMSSKVVPRLLAHLARTRTELQREAGSRIARRLRRLKQIGVNRVGAVVTFLMARAPRRLNGLKTASEAPHAGAVLVTRAMGGMGDILMMTPGLRALAQQTGQPVHFAIKKSFFPLFAKNTDVQLHDIDGAPLDPQRYRAWHDICFCPAARYESHHRPRIKKSRIELFASGMGITETQLKASGLRTRLEFSTESKNAADAFFAEHGLFNQRPIIAVHAFSRETYRDYPRMGALIEQLADRYKIIVFHHVAFPLPTHANIIPAFGQPLGDALATFAKCSLAVCVDSTFLHAAAALDMPTVALFGPTDGAIRTKHYGKAHVVSLGHAFKCMPCWRNEDIPCQLTGGRESACMAAINEREIVALVSRLLQQADVADRLTHLASPHHLPSQVSVSIDTGR